jgi:Bacterial Ig domain
VLATSEIYAPTGGSPTAVTITAPSNATTVSGTVSITTVVTSSMQWISIYIDGNYFTSSPPFSFSWDSTTVPNGSHTISAKAFNGTGQIGSDSKTVTVANGTTTGAVKITAPANGATVSGAVSIATAFSSPVVRENIYIDGNYFASSPPSTFSWDSTTVSNGSQYDIRQGLQLQRSGRQRQHHRFGG